MVDQSGEVARIVSWIGPAGDGRGGREAAMGEGHARVVRREMRDLLPPAEMIAAQAMREQKRRPVARYFIVKIAERTFESADGALGCAVGSHAWSSQKRTSLEPRMPSGQRPAA